MHRRSLASLVVAISVVSSCASGSSTTAASGSAERTTASRAHRHPTPIVLILMENHRYDQIIGNAAAPYMNAFARRGALYTDMNAIRHPSLPNYLALTSGGTLRCQDDACPPRSFRAKNIFSQLHKHGIRWRSWQESMPGRCVLHNASPYAVRHNPAAYYRNLFPRQCPRHDVPYPRRMPHRIPGFTFITPNLCHDMHDCPVAVGDGWLHQHVPPLLRRGAIVVITFDEGEGENHIYMAARGPGVGHGVRHRAHFTHFSLLAGIERHFGLRRLRHARHARPAPL